MGGGWIKLEKVLENDPRVRRMARELRNACVTLDRFNTNDAFFTHAFFVTLALGCLGRLWFYADTHVREDDSIELSIDDVNEIVGVQGFAQVLPEDWLHILDAETIKLPGFHTHNGTKAKKKALTAKRVSKHREKVTLRELKGERSGNADVTLNALPDQDQDKTKNRQDQEKEYTSRSAPDFSPEFLDFKLAYPSRAGSQEWRKAQQAARARLREGHNWVQMLDGAKRYAIHVRSTGNEGTQYVKSAGTFLGPSLHFLEPWAPVVAKTNGAKPWIPPRSAAEILAEEEANANQPAA